MARPAAIQENFNSNVTREKDEVWNSRISVSGSDPTNNHHDY